MADLTVLFRPRPPKRVTIGVITLDCTMREIHELTNQVTQNPVESGVYIADHIYRQPRRVTIEGEITDSPVEYFGGFTGITERRIEAFEQFEKLFEERELVTLVTGLKTYTDMAAVSLTAPRDERTGKRLLFTAEFEHVRKVSTQTTTIDRSKLRADSKDTGQSTAETGKQPARTPDETQRERGTSILGGWLGGEAPSPGGAGTAGNQGVQP